MFDDSFFEKKKNKEEISFDLQHQSEFTHVDLSYMEIKFYDDFSILPFAFPPVGRYNNILVQW